MHKKHDFLYLKTHLKVKLYPEFFLNVAVFKEFTILPVIGEQFAQNYHDRIIVCE